MWGDEYGSLTREGQQLRDLASDLIRARPCDDTLTTPSFEKGFLKSRESVREFEKDPKTLFNI